jgi:hypothetical protein
MSKDAIAVCPKCHAKNLVPSFSDSREPSRIPLIVTFECFTCKQTVDVLVAELRSV